MLLFEKEAFFFVKQINTYIYVKKMKKLFYVLICSTSLFCCSDRDLLAEPVINEDVEIDSPQDAGETNNSGEETTTSQVNFHLLALGDSYTIGESVCETCRFPEQLKDALIKAFGSDKTFDLKIIARTGWTTTHLMNAIDTENLTTNYDLVTLLIGVNNQYQNKPFAVYESEFPLLINTAIAKAKGQLSNVIVLSIPDYAYTPFGRNDPTISSDIDRYNTFAKNYCSSRSIDFITITDITRMGLSNPALVASDGLHPSELAYTQFVERLLPYAIKKLKN